MTNPNRVIENWETVAVTALPAGWRNAYAVEDAGLVLTACPAILVQELRSTTHIRDVPGDAAPYRAHEEVRLHEAPYATRAIFADHEDDELTPAADTTNYVTTYGPGDGPVSA